MNPLVKMNDEIESKVMCRLDNEIFPPINHDENVMLR